jgi:hypothetical protein
MHRTRRVDLGCVLGDDEEEEVKTDPHSSNAFISAIRGLMPATVEMDEWCKCIAYELDNVRINFVAAAQREAHAESLARIEELEAALEQISDSSVASLEATELTAIARAALGKP